MRPDDWSRKGAARLAVMDSRGSTLCTNTRAGGMDTCTAVVVALLELAVRWFDPNLAAPPHEDLSIGFGFACHTVTSHSISQKQLTRQNHRNRTNNCRVCGRSFGKEQKKQIIKSISMTTNTSGGSKEDPLIGVLALQGAFEEHQACLEAVGCRTVQVGAHINR